MQGAIIAELTRGPLVESVFRGDAAVVDATGRLLFAVGNPAKVTFWRSAAKPIQALPIIAAGAADRFGLGPAHLALFAASHNGEEVHVDGVRDGLVRVGLTPDLLRCGVVAPLDRETRRRLEREGLEPTPLQNNCSGKHTGMLALAQHMGFTLHDYLEPGSDIQRLILSSVAAAVDVPARSIALGTDGCGVPVFGLPLERMALAYARLADPEQMTEPLRAAAVRMRDAMLEHPYLVAGRRRICTDLTGLPGRRFLGKSGAEGVYSVGVLGTAVARSEALARAGITTAIGIALKVEDGNDAIRNLFVRELLRQLDLLNDDDLKALAFYGPGPIKNHAGRVVGEQRPAFRLQPASDLEATL